MRTLSIDESCKRTLKFKCSVLVPSATLDLMSILSYKDDHSLWFPLQMNCMSDMLPMIASYEQISYVLKHLNNKFTLFYSVVESPLLIVKCMGLLLWVETEEGLE